MGLSGTAALVRNGVIHVAAAGFRGSVGENVDRVSLFDREPHLGWSLIGVDRADACGVDDGADVDLGSTKEFGKLLGEQWPPAFDPGDTGGSVGRGRDGGIIG